jgi:hypothetical protein
MKDNRTKAELIEQLRQVREASDMFFARFKAEQDAMNEEMIVLREEGTRLSRESYNAKRERDEFRRALMTAIEHLGCGRD